ncbi:MAG: hypothetical protein HFI31_01595 [Lachnospiraceae bacterium]|nr:hypothetical protein [Lachnospiraceae bacterium]
MKNKRERELLERIRREGEALEIPESLRPEEMRRILDMEGPGQVQPPQKQSWEKEEKSWETEKNTEDKRRFIVRRRSWYKSLAAAASICLALGGTVSLWQQGFLQRAMNLAGAESSAKEQMAEKGVSGGFLNNEEQKEELEKQVFAPGVEVPSRTYEEIHQAMREVWEQQGWFSAADETQRDVRYDAAGASPLQKESAEQSLSMAKVEDLSDAAFGGTNIQTAGVDEGDRVKNDGRYLYQTVWKEEKESVRQQVQILDTREGLKELCRLDGFTDIQALYVWKDLLIVIEQKIYVEPGERREPYMIACGDVAWRDGYQEISFYDITDRSHPREKKTFTLQGFYSTSRVADGYFYSFSHYSATPGKEDQDYASYIPRVEGGFLEEKEILMPEGTRGTSYLVMVSVELEQPEEFVQTTALVCNSSLFYVSSDSIYVAENLDMERKSGWNQDKTKLTRFTYQKGHFILQAMGELPGRLDDSFSLDAHEGYLRAVSTVREYQIKDILDDRTGQTAGQQVTKERQSNALYVLDEKLKIIGRIEGLAEEEQIYAARFLGDTGYFVTFRQTDPLFAVNLSDPGNPQVLGELKVSGFSDYLHFYGKDRLLGIGIEADEETGRQKGLKLSMFDISDPANVKEIARENLADYNYTRALYDHHEILVDPGQNLIGFAAEGSNRGKSWNNYLVYAYEDEGFIPKLCAETRMEDYYGAIRGTYMGDIFYILYEDGRVKSYARDNWAVLEELDADTE